MEIRTGDQSSETQAIEWDKVTGASGYRLTCEIDDVDIISASVPASARWWMVEALGSGHTESATYFAPPELATSVVLAITFGATTTAQNPEVRGAASMATTFGASTNGQSTTESITITSPTNGATITADDTAFLVTTSDPGNVDFVEFYVNDLLVGTERTAPYGWGGSDGVANFDLSGYLDGTITFKAKVVWVSGASAITTHTCTLSRPSRIILPFTFTAVTTGTRVGESADETAFGYRPTLPAGWTLFEDLSSLSQSLYNGQTNRMFVNCKSSGLWINNGSTSNLIFIDCDFRGGTVGGRAGSNISLYACWMGDVVDDDAGQLTALAEGATRPSDWIFQGCTIRDVTRTPASGVHTDGIQFGAVVNMTVRHCYFDNIAVETILFNDWNGLPENGIVDQSYFGTRTDPGGAHIHVAGGAQNINCTNNYLLSGSQVASYQAGTTGSETGTKAGSLWPHGHPTQANPGLLGY